MTNQHPQFSDAVDRAESRFPIEDLLGCEYFRKYRKAYYKAAGYRPCRNYLTLLNALREIREYNEQHAKSFAKRFRENTKDFKNCDAIFAEVIVYHHYIRAVREQLVRKIDLVESEADVIVERPDGSRMFLEVFSVNPDFPAGEAFEVKTHLQDAMASIRQKLLRKIKTQKQMSKPRENYAVIELNNPTIAGDFHVLSSLSDGFKIQFDINTGHRVGSGYDWTESVFDKPEAEFLTGIIWFSLGDYASRKYLRNPKAAWRKPFDVETFRNNPYPKIFDPEKLVTASERFDVDAFVRTIREGRNVKPIGTSG